MKNLCFIYRWVHVPTGKWYIGSHSSKTSHPNDGYICSSKIVKPLIENNKSEWHREIILFGSKSYVREIEFKLLTLLDAKNDENSFNLHHGGNKFTPPSFRTEKDKLSISKKLTGRKLSEETKMKMRKPKSKEHAIKIGLASKFRNIGRKPSEETKEKRRQSILKTYERKRLLGMSFSPSEETKLKISTTLIERNKKIREGIHD